jgi:hypothetical protein
MAAIAILIVANAGNFNMSVQVSNSAPVVTSVFSIPNQNPIQNGIANVSCGFTVQDLNGYANLNSSSGFCSFTNGAVTRNSTSCSFLIDGTYTANYTCVLGMQYYDTIGSWTIYVRAADLGGLTAANGVTAFNYNSLMAITSSPSSLVFGTLNIGDTISATNDPITLYNQGNANLNNITIKGYDLTDGASHYFTASAFNVTITDSAGTGIAMANNTIQQIPSASAPNGAGSNEQLYFWVKVPSVYPATYTSVNSWVLAVY